MTYLFYYLIIHHEIVCVHMGFVLLFPKISVTTFFYFLRRSEMENKKKYPLGLLGENMSPLIYQTC